MQPDTMLVLGLFFCVLAIPAILSAWSDGRPPRVAAVVLVGGLALVLYAHMQKPGGYRLADVPDAVYGVIGEIIR